MTKEEIVAKIREALQNNPDWRERLKEAARNANVTNQRLREAARLPTNWRDWTVTI